MAGGAESEGGAAPGPHYRETPALPEGWREDEGVPRPEKRRLPIEIRQKMFYRALQLHEGGLSIRKIRKKLQEEFGKTVSNSILNYWIRGLHAPPGSPKPGIPQKPRPNTYCPRRIVNLEPSPDLAYVIGAMIGDGYVYRDRRGRKYVILRVKNVEFAEAVAKSLEVVLGRPVKIRFWEARRLFVVKTYSAALYNLLQKDQKLLDRVKNYIEHCEECIVSFLRGFFDAEGTVDKHGRIYVGNTDRQLLEITKELLIKRGIEVSGPYTKKQREVFIDQRTGKVYRRKSYIYELHVLIRSNQTFYQKIGFTISRKQMRLEEYLRKRGELLPPPFLSPHTNRAPSLSFHYYL